jgi:hypothetical protein
MAFDSTVIRPDIGDLPEITDLEDRIAFVEENVTPAQLAVLDGKVSSSDIDQMVVVTQETYDALIATFSADSRTMYVVVG